MYNWIFYKDTMKLRHDRSLIFPKIKTVQFLIYPLTNCISVEIEVIQMTLFFPL